MNNTVQAECRDTKTTENCVPKCRDNVWVLQIITLKGWDMNNTLQAEGAVP